MKVVCLWSGGKDSCFAYYKAKQLGYDVVTLLNFIHSDNEKVLSHGFCSDLILLQAENIGVPVVQEIMPKDKYRENFKRLIYQMKEEHEIQGIVFGDIFLQEHKDWIDKICAELEVKAIMPLWGVDTGVLIKEFIEEGFKSIIIAVKKELLEEKFLGCRLDEKFIKNLDPEIDPCAERGEFHTFVYDGPVFKKAVEFSTGKKVLQDKHMFLEVKGV
jgi:diphthine-ammonia ligase